MGKRHNHLYEIDLMRAFIMMSVLSVHTTSFFNTMNPVTSPGFLVFGALITSLHYTREAFMFMTGLVLLYTYYERPFHMLTFLRKRFLLIIVPYLVFNALYLLFEGLYAYGFEWNPRWLLREYGLSLITGNQFFMYYIVVTIQLYLVFPLLLYGLRRLERWHLHIFVISFLVQVGLMALNKFVLMELEPSSLPRLLRILDIYRDRFILTYQFWFIAGGIMACHYEAVLNLVNRHRRALRITLILGLCVLWAHYLFDRLIVHESEALSDLVLQPIMVPYSLVATLNMWYAGVGWAKRRSLVNWRPFSRFVEVAAAASFGIFLIQPFPLRYMAETIIFFRGVGIPLWLHYGLLPFCVLFVYCSGMVLAHTMGKVPVLSYVVGRKPDLTQHKRTHRPQAG